VIGKALWIIRFSFVFIFYQIISLVDESAGAEATLVFLCSEMSRHVTIQILLRNESRATSDALEILKKSFYYRLSLLANREFIKKFNIGKTNIFQFFLQYLFLDIGTKFLQIATTIALKYLTKHAMKISIKMRNVFT
jgi:hypothetical protein